MNLLSHNNSNFFISILCLIIVSCAAPKNQPKLTSKDKMDDDKDGIINFYDKCSETPADVLVDAKGCPLDNDGDGVPDYLDKEPNSRAGAKVDFRGVEIIPDSTAKINIQDTTDLFLTREDTQKEHQEKSYTNPEKEFNELLQEYALPVVYYKINHYKLTKFQKYQLDAIAPLLTLNPAIVITVEGHTDKAGPADYNKKLSEKRSLEAAEYLVNKDKIQSYQVQYTFYGEEKPASGSQEETPNSIDRRSELKFTIQIDKTKLDRQVIVELLKYKDPVFELQQLIIQYGTVRLQYGVNQYTLTYENRDKLDKIIPVLQVHPRIKVKMDGHTDKSGDENYNMKLSENRAKTASGYILNKKLVSDKQVTYHFHGETKPLSGSTEEKRNELDRRVEVNFELVDR
ncbi:MAG: hypothetical protein A3G23_00730 [Bacteroidetes bacterium RIFCSPLOWO2_12_FULL_37_12]|nr:MAG: hypothetical protein A3G23_00730 [Bacteroidetes bacterium RIFCSPLOWO2_12_FULL_37_12]